jgi:hypothetical protein
MKRERQTARPMESFFGQNLHSVKRKGTELFDFTPKEIGALVVYASSLPKRVSTKIISEDPLQIKINYETEADAIQAEQILTYGTSLKQKDRPSLDGSSKEEI